MIWNLTVNVLPDLVSFVFRNLYYKKLNFLIVTNNGILIARISLFEILSQRFDIVILVLHKEKESIGNSIWNSRLFNNRDVGTILTQNRCYVSSSIRKYTIFTC